MSGIAATTTVSDHSDVASGKLRAQIDTVSTGLQVSQVINFNENDPFITVEVTISNTGTSTKNDVRYEWWFDPDNSVDMGGGDDGYTTKSTVINTFAAGDPNCVLEVESAVGGQYYSVSGSTEGLRYLFFR